MAGYQAAERVVCREKTAVDWEVGAGKAAVTPGAEAAEAMVLEAVMSEGAGLNMEGWVGAVVEAVDCVAEAGWEEARRVVEDQQEAVRLVGAVMEVVSWEVAALEAVGWAGSGWEEAVRKAAGDWEAAESWVAAVVEVVGWEEAGWEEEEEKVVGDWEGAVMEVVGWVGAEGLAEVGLEGVAREEMGWGAAGMRAQVAAAKVWRSFPRRLQQLR